MKENTGAAPQLNIAPPEPAGTPPAAPPPRRTASAPLRREGGQPGNQNARVHGFYSKYATAERQEIMEEAALLEGLDAEIVLLRSKIERLEELDPDNVKLFSELIRGLSLVMVRRKYAGASALFAKARKIINSFGAAAGAAGGVAEVVEAVRK